MTAMLATQLGGLVELNDAYFGGVSHGLGKRGRDTDQDPVVVGMSLDIKEHARHIFMDALPDLKERTVLEILDKGCGAANLRASRKRLSMANTPGADATGATCTLKNLSTALISVT